MMDIDDISKTYAGENIEDPGKNFVIRGIQYPEEEVASCRELDLVISRYRIPIPRKELHRLREKYGYRLADESDETLHDLIIISLLVVMRGEYQFHPKQTHPDVHGILSRPEEMEFSDHQDIVYNLLPIVVGYIGIKYQLHMISLGIKYNMISLEIGIDARIYDWICTRIDAHTRLMEELYG
jgi:hypothetical protein